MAEAVWNDEQAEETLDRFCDLTPKLQADNRFGCGVGLLSSGIYTPFVYLKAHETEETPIPHKHLLITRQQEGFFIRLVNIYILLGTGILSDRWPEIVSDTELDEVIFKIWEAWFRLKPEDDARYI